MELLHPLSIYRANTLYDAVTFRAICLATDVVGNCVYIRAGLSGGLFRVGRADPKQLAKMPAVGIIIEKITATECIVQKTGITTVFTGLNPNGSVFVGLDGNYSQLVPVASVGEHIFIQKIGIAFSEEHLLVNPNPICGIYG